MTKDEAIRAAQAAASMVKLTCGVCNNAAWLVCLHALDELKHSSRYRGEAKRAFKQTVEMLHQYERRLIYATTNRMFCVADMTEETRKKYGNITDREYYDFWKSQGAQAYQGSWQWVCNLQNKYRLSLLHHGIDDAASIAWGMTAQASLEVACTAYRSSIKTAKQDTGFPQRIIDDLFTQFSLEAVTKAWKKALTLYAPDGMAVDPDATEQRNIELGIEQLHDVWLDPETLFGSTIEAVENYDEVFRTKGEMKKALRELAEVRADVQAELQQGTMNYERTTD